MCTNSTKKDIIIQIKNKGGQKDDISDTGRRLQKDTPKKEEKPVKKAEKKETPVAYTPKDEAAPKEKTVDRKTVRAFLAEKSRAGKTSEVKNLIEQFGFQKLSDVPDEKLPELYEKAQVL